MAALDWTALRNPVLAYDTWSIKDYAVAHRDGVWYIFFSAFYEDDGQVRSHMVEVSTMDFRAYSRPLLNVDGREEGWVGMCSPNVTQIEDTYCLTYNSWGDKLGQPNQLFYMTSTDLVHWSPRKPLAADLTNGNRAIDAAIAFENNRLYLAWKDSGTIRLAVSASLDGEFSPLGPTGRPTLHMADGRTLDIKHENYQFIKVDGQWRLLTIGLTSPVDHYLYTMTGRGADDADWLSWHRGYALTIPEEPFNAHHKNAGALYDWRAHDGYFYLLYGGRTENTTFISRGHYRLGLARSTDLVHWLPAGATPV